MNWLEIIYMVILPVLAVVWIGSKLLAVYGKRGSGWWCTPLMITIMTVIGLFIALPPISMRKTYLDREVYNSSELISLSNQGSVSGSIIGQAGFLGGGAFKGSLTGSTTCTFVSKAPTGVIRVITEDCSNVIFVVGESSKIEKWVGAWYYTYSLKGVDDQYWNLDDYHWKITIPEDSINSYIRFN
tara:strand:- start:1915 stop:2469 length:555 start_codon:yes stop_codon:yes gene_type:complete